MGETGEGSGHIRLMRDGRLKGHMSLRACSSGTELVLVVNETKRWKHIPLMIYLDLLEFLQKEYLLTRKNLHSVSMSPTRLNSAKRQEARRRARGEWRKDRKKKRAAKAFRKPRWAVQQVIRMSGLVEDICKHGVGHPNKDSLKEMKRKGLKGYEIHGCDGCCSTRSGVKK